MSFPLPLYIQLLTETVLCFHVVSERARVTQGRHNCIAQQPLQQHQEEVDAELENHAYRTHLHSNPTFEKRCRFTHSAMWNSAENAFARSASYWEDGEDEEALRWAALERLPTYARVRRGIFKNLHGDWKEVDVSELEAEERKLLLERLINTLDHDPGRFFDRMRGRFDA